MAEEFDLAVRSHRLRAQRFGSLSAPLVIGLHGLQGNMKYFDFIGERVGGDDMQLVALDLRGRGQSEATGPGTYGWDNHALDVFAVADALGFDRFSIVGQSMGGSVAMKAAEIDGPRLDAVVLVDIAGRVDRGVGAVVASVLALMDGTYASVERYVDAARSLGLVEEWNEHWERAFRHGIEAVDGGIRPRGDPTAIAEDREYTLTQHPYERWKHLTMPTLLLRATREFRPGSGHVIPADDAQRFLDVVPRGQVVEIDANHLTITAHPDTADAIHRFLRDVAR